MSELKTSFNTADIRDDFPALQQSVHGKPLIYFDNAATTQKPHAVIEAEKYYYEHDNANVHRAVHALGGRATKSYEDARKTVQQFIHAKKTEEIVFLRSTTEAINLVAQTFVRQMIKSGDEILITQLEHHSNIVPWQILCEQTGANLKVVPITEEGDVTIENFKSAITDRTRFISVSHVSNALGTVLAVKTFVELAHAKDIPIMIDGAQAAPHAVIDVQDLDCDFYALSGHKVYGPTGIGALYGKYNLLDSMPPYQGGGEMILRVSFDNTVYNQPPFKFEAGTPNIAGAIGFAAALNYVSKIGLKTIAEHEHALLVYATEKMQQCENIRIVGTAKNKASVISFIHKDIHPHDIGTILDYDGIAIRAGHHCAMPVMEFFNVPATARVSFSFYNTFEEIDVLIAALKKLNEVFK